MPAQAASGFAPLGLRFTENLSFWSAGAWPRFVIASTARFAVTKRCQATAPRNLSRYQIPEADAKLAGRKQIVVVTTIGEAVEHIFNDKFSERDRVAVRTMLVQNLELLRKHHVPIAIGSDSFRQTALAEALSLAKLQAFDNLTLLKMWCEATAATIFPKRKIGYLKDGYEASFLVLTGNPLSDFASVKTIELRIKRGEPLEFR